MLAPWKKSYDKPRQRIKKQRQYIANKGPYSQSYGFSSSHRWMWELDNKIGWVLKNWCLQTVVLEKTLESPLDFKEIKLVNSKINQHWILIGRADAEAEAPILWPPDAKSWLNGKDPTQWLRSLCWEGVKVGGEGDNRRWNGWMASLTKRTWVWANSRRWWRTGKPVMLQSMRLKELDTTEWLNNHHLFNGINPFRLHRRSTRFLRMLYQQTWMERKRQKWKEMREGYWISGIYN